MTDAIAVRGVGVCCPDADLLARFRLEGGPADAAAIPAPLRRRASQATKLAITAARRACDGAGVNPHALPSVFASVGGEIQVTDILCRALPDPDGYVSPTQFHNSVHNTTSGYWSIINGCSAPTTAVASGRDTVAMAFLEAWSLLTFEPGQVLVVCYDEAWPEYLAPPMGAHPFAAALVLGSATDGDTVRLGPPRRAPNPPAIAPDLSRLIERMPITASIPLLQGILARIPGPVPLSADASPWTADLSFPQPEEDHDHAP